MGGEVSVTSELGRGSTFVMTLPASLRAEVAVAECVEEAEAEHPDGRLVLIIDDDGTARELIGRFLEREGYRSVAAASGAEGLALARRVRPAAIILDVLMPGMDGWTVLASLKSDPLTAEIPVVMVTMVDDRNLGFALGATGYLLKPVDRDRLRAVIRGCAGEGDALRHVMVVDADPEARQLLRRALETEAYDVVEAGDEREAMALLTIRAPDLILLDLVTHGGEAFHLPREMRAHPEWREIPIVVMTGKEVTGDDPGRLGSGAAGTWKKDGSAVDALLQEVAELIARTVHDAGAPGAGSA